ncbi:hypothetical protein OXPF_18270 [Oxobacter pfennigii]|uniref:Anti-sigma-W factor RsiW n=1 Tax=Oxobacter pfennigii TaxID=36849 RepID=A0A0P9AH20_9CLOT|nr:zf-HC2 domain-containing protein [Oxobacter pfennigii]KPU44741.1 hypothetical protein OXPF_18270 [Oxobacter pfennigii]
MDCKMDYEYLQGYLDDTLNPVEKIIVKEHINTCSSCKKELIEMKLLMWELDEFMLSEIEVPKEAALIRKKITEECTKSKRFSVKDLLSVQKNIRKHSTIFLNYVPGFKTGVSLAQKTAKKAPAFVYKTLTGMYAGGRKLAALRSQL